MVIPILIILLLLVIVILLCHFQNEKFKRVDDPQNGNNLFTFMKQQRTFSPCSKYIKTTHFPYMEPLYVNYENPYYEPIINGKPLSCKKGMFRGNTGLFPLFNPKENLGNPWIHIGVIRNDDSNILMLYRRLIGNDPEYVKVSPTQMMKIGDKCTVEFKAVDEATNQEFYLGNEMKDVFEIDGKQFKTRVFSGF